MSYDYDNFLSPDTLKDFKKTNQNFTNNLIRDIARRKVWQPDKLIFNKNSEIAGSMRSKK